MASKLTAALRIARLRTVLAWALALLLVVEGSAHADEPTRAPRTPGKESALEKPGPEKKGAEPAPAVAPPKAVKPRTVKPRPEPAPDDAARPAVRPPRKPSERDPSTTLRAEERTPGPRLGPMMPILYDGGIRVTSPLAGQIFVAGQGIDVRYEVSRGGPVSSSHFIMICHPHPGPQGHRCLDVAPRNDVDLDGHVRVRPLSGLPARDDYRILVQEMGPDSSVRYGYGEFFSIRAVESGGSDAAHGVAHLVSPDGGETWLQGQTHAIRWRTEPDPAEGRHPRSWSVYIVRDGVRGERIAAATARDYEPASREYRVDWRIPRGFAGAALKIRVEASDNPFTDAPLADESHGTFSVADRSIIVRWPPPTVGGTLYRTREYRIHWSIEGDVREALNVFLMRHSGRLPIASGVPASPGRVAWRIPVSTTDSLSGYSIRVESAEDPSIFGEGPEFTLATPTITVTSPIGGQRLSHGNTERIEWSCPDLEGRVRLDLVHADGRATWINTVDAQDGSLPWVVGMFHDAPDATGDGFKIRVTSEHSGLVLGESVGTFSILPVP